MRGDVRTSVGGVVVGEMMQLVAYFLMNPTGLVCLKFDATAVPKMYWLTI